MVRRITASPETTVPLIDATRLPRIMPGFHLWDFWPVMEWADPTRVARIDGWQVVIALTAPDDLLPEARHDVATHRALVSREGRAWTDIGDLYPPGAALGTRQWAGSACYDADRRRLVTWHTAAGRAGDAVVSYEQRIAMADAAVTVTGDGPRFDDWSDHRVVLDADGALYRRTGAGSAQPGMIDAFRDPQRFRDPHDGRQYLLFTGSLAAARSDHDGAVGIAEATDESLSEWRLLPPLLHADDVNNELERPHIVVRDGRYYLFFITHPGTFAPGLTGPEGLYGFVAERLFGPWRPLNGSGLVLGNPPEAMYQSYSWFVLPNLRVLSFLDYVDIGGRTVADVTREAPDYQLAHFGGTIAPTLTIALDRDRTRLVREEYDLVLE
jgi:levansucrase